MLDSILKFLEQFWEAIKKVFVKIINLVTHIDKWFENKYGEVVNKTPKAKPVAVKIEEAIKSGKHATRSLNNLGKKYKIVNTFYDPVSKTISENYTEIVASDKIDNNTLEAFGDEDVLVYE